MTFHLCCTQPQRTFGFWFRALAAVGSEKLGIWISFLPACNSLRGSGLKVAAERHLSAQNYTLLKHIKSHLVGHSAPHPHKLTHIHRKSPQDAFAPASATACALSLRFLLGVLNVGQMNAKNFGLLALLLDHYYYYYYFTG